MKKYLFAALALTALVACSKDDDPTAVLTSSEKSVTISIANMASGTRASNGAATSPATEKACTSIDGNFRIYFLDKDDKLVVSFTGTQLNAGTYGSAGTYTFNGLPATVKSIIAAGNTAGFDAPVGTVVDLETIMQSEANVMNKDWSIISNLPVYDKETLQPVTEGGNQVYVGNYAAYKATLNIAPRFARIEITQISCTDFGDATLGYDAIGVQKISLHGNAAVNDTNPANDKYVIELNTELDTDAEVSGGTLASCVLTNAYPTLTAVNGKAWDASGGKVWSWNIEPQAISNLITSLYVSGQGYTAINPTRTVTINSYKKTSDPTTPITTFDAGNIYRFAINFSHENMDSDANYIVADVDIEIASWVVNEVTPGFATGN